MIDAADIDDAQAPAPDRREAYDPTDIASDIEIRRTDRELPSAGDSDAWERLCAPVVEALAGNSMTMFQVRRWSERHKPRIPVKIAEECIYWLETRGRVVAFKGWDGRRQYWLVGGTSSAALEDIQPDAKPAGKQEEAMATGEWISTEDAAKLMGISDSRVKTLARLGKVEAKKDESYTGKGHKPYLVNRDAATAYSSSAARADVIKARIVKLKRVGAVAPKAKRADPIVERKPARRDPSASSPVLADDVRMLVRCVERGWLEPSDAWEKLKALVA